jgi:hypothetical protein
LTPLSTQKSDLLLVLLSSTSAVVVDPQWRTTIEETETGMDPSTGGTPGKTRIERTEAETAGMTDTRLLGLRPHPAHENAT